MAADPAVCVFFICVQGYMCMKRVLGKESLSIIIRLSLVKTVVIFQSTQDAAGLITAEFIENEIIFSPHISSHTNLHDVTSWRSGF